MVCGYVEKSNTYLILEKRTMKRMVVIYMDVSLHNVPYEEKSWQ